MAEPALTRDELKQLIISSLGLEGYTPDAIGDEDPLFGGGLGLDSVDALELIVALEKRLKIKIRGTELKPEDFANVGNMHRFIEEQQALARGSAE